MENIEIDEEPILSYYSSTSNFGVCSKDIKSEKIIKMSFSPLSSNHKISFSNTIMIPLVATETSLNKGKNISNNYKKEKSKTPINKDNEKHKLELTDKDKSKFLDKKQMTKIFEEEEKRIKKQIELKREEDRKLFLEQQEKALNAFKNYSENKNLKILNNNHINKIYGEKSKELSNDKILHLLDKKMLYFVV